MSRSSVQLNLPPAPLQRVERHGEAVLHKVENDDLPLEKAKELAGEIVRAVLKDTDATAKEFGDKSQVGRWARGLENPNLAKLIASTERRKAMARALLKSCGGVKRREVWEIEEVG